MFIKETISSLGCIWRIYSVCDDHGKSILDTSLDSLSGKDRKEARRLAAILERISRENLGPKILDAADCHNIADGIFQFSVGTIRVAWFYDAGRIIICAHAFRKDSRKTKKCHIERAEEVSKKYFRAKAKEEIEIIQAGGEKDD